MLSPIAAIGTPFGKGALAVIRVSGEGTLELCRRVFSPKSGDISARRALYGVLRDPSTGEEIDDGILLYYKAPHSYTGEDSAEFSCHGGTVVTALALKAFLDAGARMAFPGEFTRRAFAAGKLSLSRAEGIADLIDAKTDAAARLSRRAASGSGEAKLEQAVQELIQVCASLSVTLDYPEEHLAPSDASALAETLGELRQRLESLAATLTMSSAVLEGVPAYIVGRFNVGKSSLFNALLGEERAIVTELPGTTRDQIEYPLQAGRLLLRLTDTAGLREGADRVEQLGIDRTREKLSQGAGFVVFALFDSGEEAMGEDLELIREMREWKTRHMVLPILSKTDRPQRFDTSLLSEFEAPFCVSLLDSPSFAPLFARLEAHFIEDENALVRGEVLMNLRQYDCVKRALSLLAQAQEHCGDNENDICVTLLEEAIGALNEADGKEVAASVADEIFRRFCVGK